jgi:hypothetical protein
MPSLQQAALHVSIVYNMNKEVSVAGSCRLYKSNAQQKKISHHCKEKIIVTFFRDAVSATLVYDMGI